MVEEHEIRDANGTDAKSVGLTRALEMMRHVWAVDHAVRQLSRAMHAHLGLTGPQRLVMRFVGAQPGIKAGTLASLLSLDASTLTGHLQKLEDGGLLERRASPEDGRRVLVHLTAKGKRLDVMTPGTVEAAVDAVLADTNAGDVAGVQQFLARLVDSIDAQVTIVTPPHTRKSDVQQNGQKNGKQNGKRARQAQRRRRRS